MAAGSVLEQDYPTVERKLRGGIIVYSVWVRRLDTKESRDMESPHFNVYVSGSAMHSHNA
jgi:hypothetical protein